MLAWKLFKNTEWKALNVNSTITKINYIVGFARQKWEKQEKQELRAGIQKMFNERLPILPTSPNEIMSEIKIKLPHQIPIKYKSHVIPTVIGLHNYFKFEKLPTTYFAQLPNLPQDPNELDTKWKSIFPIINKETLKNLKDIR